MIWTCFLSFLVLACGGSRSVGYTPKNEELLKQKSHEIGIATVEAPIIRNTREIDESVEEAQARLFNVDRAADAVTGIERGIHADPMYIEDQTDQVTRQLKADVARYKAAKKNNVARDDESVISLAKRILKIVTTLEVAKFIADSRARQGVEIAQRRGIHRPTAYQFPQYNFGYLYGLPSGNPIADMTQPYQQQQHDATAAQLSNPLPPPPPAPPPLPPLPAVPPPMLVPEDTPPALPVQGFVPMTNAFVKENTEASPPPPKPKAVSQPSENTPKHHLLLQKPHVPAQKPSEVITPEDRAQWSIFGESLPMAPSAENIAPLQVPQIEQPQPPVMEQFTSTDTPEHLVNPASQENDASVNKPSESKAHDLPGLRPLNSDVLNYKHHKKKPDLSVKPPPVHEPSSYPVQADISPPPNYFDESSPPQLLAPPTPPPAPAPPIAPPPAPPLAPPPAPPPSPPPSSPPLSQMDFSNQMFPSMQQTMPIVPMSPPQFFASNFIPLASIPLPVFLPDDTPDVRLAKQKEYESRRSAIAVENIEKAIGLDERTIESLIDDVKHVSQRQTIEYENAVLKDKKEEEEAVGEKKVETEDKLLRDEELEGKAKETVDQINRLEKVMTIVEAAKFDAQRRASQQLLAAEAWKDKMYGRAKKSKIMNSPIVKKEEHRRSTNKSSKISGARSRNLPTRSVVAKNNDNYRIKRSYGSQDLLQIKFKKIRNLAKEIQRKVQARK